MTHRAPLCNTCRMPLHYSVCPRCIDTAADTRKDSKLQTKIARMVAELRIERGQLRDREKWDHPEDYEGEKL